MNTKLVGCVNLGFDFGNNVSKTLCDFVPVLFVVAAGGKNLMKS